MPAALLSAERVDDLTPHAPSPSPSLSYTHLPHSTLPPASPSDTSAPSLSPKPRTSLFFEAIHDNSSNDPPESPRPSSSVARPRSRSRTASLSFLRRTPSGVLNSKAHDVKDPESSVVPPVPRLPNTRISQAHADAATRRSESISRTEGTNMLRKVSRSRQEKERQSREAAQAASAAAAQRQPPSLPLPSFTEESTPESRDSVAIFNSAYTHSSSQPRHTANFSRPQMPLSSANNSSSSPAYAARPGDGPAASSSPPTTGPGNGEYVASDRAQSMTHRGRYSYASSVGQGNSVSSPRRVRRRKDPTPFNVLVVGAKNSGKTSFLSFLRHSLALPAHKQTSEPQPQPQAGSKHSSFKSDYLETEIDGERVGLTLWDSVGLEKHIVDLQLREMTAFVEAKFEDTFVEEQKVKRSPGAKDTHIHCVFLVLDPVRLDTTVAESSTFHKNGSLAGSLDEHLDLQVIRALWGKTTVIPVISKADTLTFNHMKFLKRAVWGALRGAGLNPMEALELEEDEEEDDGAEDEDSSAENGSHTPEPKKIHKRQSSMSAALLVDDEAPYIPMSVLSPDIYDMPPYVPASRAAKPEKFGRQFPWGFADPYNPEHCDFGRFRDSIFSEWRSELRELSQSKWYENWRTSRLQNLPGARQRVKGGVTPVTAVPREGRLASGSRQFSPPSALASMGSNASLTAGGAIPRSVSNMTDATAAAGSVNGEPTRDFSGSNQVGSVQGSTYRSVESYK